MVGCLVQIPLTYKILTRDRRAWPFPKKHIKTVYALLTGMGFPGIRVGENL